MTRLVRVTLCATAVMLAGCVGATVDSSAPVDQASSGSWATRAPLPTARQEVAVAALGERIYVIGGFGAAAEPVATVEAYDVATDTWTAPAPYPVPVHHAAAAVVAGRLYVVGGYTGGRVSWSRLVSLYEYDPTRNAWVARAAMPTPRGALAVAVVGDRLQALGGDADGVTGAHEVYDPRSDRWTSAASVTATFMACRPHGHPCAHTPGSSRHRGRRRGRSRRQRRPRAGASAAAPWRPSDCRPARTSRSR